MIIKAEKLQGRTGHEAGRALLDRLCGHHEIAVTERGKPYFTDGSCHFSISHTKSHVFCAVSEVPVGVDAEPLDRNIDLRLAQKILSPSERERYEQSVDKRLALLKLWVLKEAQAKATGEGLRGYPNKTDFSPDDPRVQILEDHFVAIIEMRNDDAV